MKKRVFMLLMTLILILFSVEVAAPTKEKGMEEIRVATWDEVEGLRWTEVAFEKFETVHPDIKIKIESVPQGYSDRILTSIAGGNPPDIFLWWNLPQLAELGGVEPLDEYGIDFDNIEPSLNKWASYKGTIYGVTKDYSCEVIWYNREVFDKYGVSYPTDDWTWEEYRQKAIQLTHPEDRVYGTVFTEDPAYNLEEWASMNGGGLLAPDGSTMKGYLNSRETIEALKFLIDLILVDNASAKATTVEALGGNYEMLATGRVAMIETGTWFAGYLKSRNLDPGPFATVLLPHPEGRKTRNMMNTSFWVLSSACEYREEAVKVLKWLAQEGGRTQAEGGWALPTSRKVAEELGLLEDPVKSTFLRALEYAVPTPPFLRTSKWWEFFEQYIGDALDKMLLGKSSVEEALNWAVNESEKAMGKKK